MVSRATIHEAVQSCLPSHWGKRRRRHVKRALWKLALALIPLTLFGIIVYVVLSIQ